MTPDSSEEKVTEGNIESFAFVDRAIRLDKEKFLELTRKVNQLIEELQRSGANPVTIYYITRALNGYASDRLEAFGKAVEKDRPPESTITAGSIKEACDNLFSIALEDAAKMTEAEQRKLIEEQLSGSKKKDPLAGYI
mgnify:CR=1 FL=1